MDPALKVTLGGLGAVLVALAVVLALRHVQHVHRDRLGRLAERRGGRLLTGRWFVVPRVEWCLGDGLLQASLRMESAEVDERAGLCSVVQVSGPRIPHVTLELRRAERLPGEWQVPRTRDAAFARAFRLRTDDERLARALLDGELRRALLAFAPALDVALRLGTAPVYRDGVRHRTRREPRLEVSLLGVPADVSELERLVALARLAYARLERQPAHRAA